MAATPTTSASAAVAHSAPAALPDPALIAIGLSIAVAIAGLNLYRLWLDREGVEPDIEDFSMPGDWMDARGESARSRASAGAVLKIITVLTLAAATVGAAAALRMTIWSVLPFIAFVIVGGAVVFAVLHIVWLWDDRREDAFASVFARRKDVWWLYDERAVRTLFFQQNRMPVWTVFDRSWREKLIVPNAFEMQAVTVAAKRACGDATVAELPAAEPSAADR